LYLPRDHPHLLSAVSNVEKCRAALGQQPQSSSEDTSNELALRCGSIGECARTLECHHIIRLSTQLSHHTAQCHNILLTLPYLQFDTLASPFQMRARMTSSSSWSKRKSTGHRPSRLCRSTGRHHRVGPAAPRPWRCSDPRLHSLPSSNAVDAILAHLEPS
jgi:hypothetical protein